MITKEDLDGLKLVTDEANFASDIDAVATIERAVTQGSQAWGVNIDTAVILTLAKSLRDALTLANLAETAANQLKGEQMARGRVQKQLDDLKVQSLEYVEALAKGGEREKMLTERITALTRPNSTEDAG